ncbi:putative adenylate kinase [Helianthus annuus]|nr:putative adenylate kinase [Helianthus annuus]KAJ0814084.1 putative adenylate kinase [Helianthus annuus]
MWSFLVCNPIFMQRDEMLGTRGFKVDKVLNFAIDNAYSEERIHDVWIHPSSG